MDGIWNTFEVSKITNFLTGKDTGESTGIAGSPGFESTPKRRSLYLPMDVDCVKSGITKINKLDVEDNLILNRYAPKTPSNVPEQGQADSNTESRNETETYVDAFRHNNGDVIIDVRRDARNNTMSLNFTTR